MNRRYFYFAILVLIIAAVLYIFLLQNDGIDERIEVQNSGLIINTDSFATIKMTIRNVSQDTISKLSIGVEIYDQNGTKLSEETLMTGQVLPGELHELDYPLPDMGNASDFKIKSISEKTEKP